MKKYSFDDRKSITNQKFDKMKIQKNYDEEAFIVEQNLIQEFPKFFKYTRVRRKEFLESNKELKLFYKNKIDTNFDKTRSNKIFKSDQKFNNINDYLIEEFPHSEEDYSNIEFPGEKISNFCSYSDLISVINLETKSKIPTGIFCFPCKENFRTDECFEIKHLVKIDKFEKFEAIMENVKTYYDWFSDYPHDREDSEKIENEYFVIYTFFKAISKISSQYEKYSFDEKLKDLIQIFSNILEKKFNIIYKILSNFWRNFKNKLKIDYNKNKPSSISTYRELYCQICFKYLCKIHIYKEYDFNNSSKSNKTDIQKIYRQEMKKNSGKVTHINRSNFAMLNKIKSNNNLEQIFERHDLEKNFICHRTISSNCKHNQEITLENNSSSKDESFYNHLIHEIRNKRHLYLLCCLVMSECLTNSCFISRFVFQGEYKCFILNKIIAILQNETLYNVIDNYLNGGNRFNNFSHNLSSNFPQISKEKLKINYITDIPNTNVKKTGKQIGEKTDFSPCSHEGTCNRENCKCIRFRGICEKFCSCREYCEYQYKGCDCKDGCIKPEIDLNGEYKSNQYCKCVFDLRECDPDICQCKGVDVYYKNEEDYKKCLKSNKDSNSTGVVLCKNMPMNYRSFKLTTLGRSILCDSYGLFAREDIGVNDLICEYTGEILNKQETDRRTLFNEQLGLNYLFQLTEKIDIDAYRIGNEMRYVNHSSHGYQNCYARTKFVRGNYKICLYAERKINKGEELFFDYLLKVYVPWLSRYNRYYG